MKKCLYCNEFIDTENDDYQKVGKKLVCVFCYEDYADEIDNNFGRLLWLKVTEVVILTEKVRQSKYVLFHNILQKLRHNTIQKEDIAIIKRNVIKSNQIKFKDWLLMPIIVSRNNLRLAINTMKIFELAKFYLKKFTYIVLPLSRIQRICRMKTC